MTLREEVHSRIDKLDDAALSKLIEQIDRLEQKEGRSFSAEFTKTLEAVRERNKHDDPDTILEEITEEVKADRQSQRR